MAQSAGQWMKKQGCGRAADLEGTGTQINQGPGGATVHPAANNAPAPPPVPSSVMYVPGPGAHKHTHRHTHTIARCEQTCAQYKVLSRPLRISPGTSAGIPFTSLRSRALRFHNRVCVCVCVCECDCVCVCVCALVCERARASASPRDAERHRRGRNGPLGHGVIGTRSNLRTSRCVLQKKTNSSRTERPTQPQGMHAGQASVRIHSAHHCWCRFRGRQQGGLAS